MADDFVPRMKARVEAQKSRAVRLYDQAKRRIPEGYHDFLILLPQRIKLGDFEAKGELAAVQGVESWSGKTFLALELPYVSVDGRVKMFLDEHKDAGKKFRITVATAWTAELTALLMAAKGALDAAAVAELIKAVPTKLKNVLVAAVESEVYGSTQGSAKIGWGEDASGVDRTNPYENAQTSAVGRALGFMGYGLIGGGIASYEEVRAAVAEQDALDKKEVKPRPPTPIKTEGEVKKGAPNTVPAGSLQGDANPTPTTAPASEPQAVLGPAAADPAAVQDKGNCPECGEPLPPGLQKYILTLRKQGKVVRWSHNSVIQGMSCEVARKLREQEQQKAAVGQ